MEAGTGGVNWANEASPTLVFNIDFALDIIRECGSTLYVWWHVLFHARKRPLNTYNYAFCRHFAAFAEPFLSHHFFPRFADVGGIICLINAMLLATPILMIHSRNSCFIYEYILNFAN